MRDLHPAARLVATVYLLLAAGLAAAQTTHIVTVGDNFFGQGTRTIEVGDTVRWVNAAGGNPHNVTSTDNAFPPSMTASSFTFEVTFTETGVFDYFCTVHPSQMQGTITVIRPQEEDEADLEMRRVLAENGSYGPGDTLNIDVRIRNIGDADSAPLTVTYYASDDTTITTADTELGSDQLAAIPMSTTVDHPGSVTVPASAPPGHVFIGAIVTENGSTPAAAKRRDGPTLDDADPSNDANVDDVSVYFTGDFQINAGLNDAWFNADTAGQGFFFIVFPDISLFFGAWFTYDTARPPQDVQAILGDPGHRWVTIQGVFEPGDTAVVPAVLTEGGVFDSAQPMPADGVEMGTVTVVFHDCNNATLTYDFDDPVVGGAIELRRIAGDNIPLCQELNVLLQSNP